MSPEVMLWNVALSTAGTVIGWLWHTSRAELHDTKTELHRISILLNRSREEMAKEYVTKQEVHADINRVISRLEALDAKFDRLMERIGN